MPSLLPYESRDSGTDPVSNSLLDRAEAAQAGRPPPLRRPRREEIRRQIAARRRREAREDKAATTGLALAEESSAPLDAETRLYNRHLAQKIADAGRSDGIAPILKDALRHDPNNADPQIEHLAAELRQRAPAQAAEVERLLAQHRRARPRSRLSRTAPSPSQYMEFPDMPEITEAEDVGFWESFLPNIQIGLTTDPIEEALIIRDAFSDEVGGIYQDSFGNPIINFRGKDYYINKPGYSRQDLGTVINAAALAAPLPRLVATTYRLNKDASMGLHGPQGPLGGGGSLALERYVPPVTAPIQGPDSSNFDMVEPQPSGPPPNFPLEPEDQGQILVNVPPDLEELLTQIPPTPGFTLADKDDIVEIFPDQSGEIPLGLIVENRGSPRIQEYNELIRRIIQEILVARGYDKFFKHRGGAEDQEVGGNKKEMHFKGHWTGNLREGSFIDLTFKNTLNKRHLHINTTDVYANRLDETKREKEAAHRILVNGRSGDILLLIPKLLPGETLDEDYLREVLEQLIDELLGPKPEEHPRDSDDLDAHVRRLNRPPTRP